MSLLLATSLFFASFAFAAPPPGGPASAPAPANPSPAGRAAARKAVERAMRALLEAERRGVERRAALGPEPAPADVVPTIEDQLAALGALDLSGVPSDLRDDLAALKSGLLATVRALSAGGGAAGPAEAERLRMLGGILAQVQARTLHDAAGAGAVLPEFGACWPDAAALLFDDAVWLAPDPAASKAPAVQRLVNALAANADRQWFETLSPLPPREAALACERDAAFVEGLPAGGLPDEVAETLARYAAALRSRAAAHRAAEGGGAASETTRKEFSAELALWAAARAAGADTAALVERWRNGRTTGPTRPPTAFTATRPGGGGAEIALKSLLMHEAMLARSLESENALAENPARAAELIRETVGRIRRGSRTGCPPGFLAALDGYLRAREGLASTLEQFAASASLPEPQRRDRQAVLVWEAGHRAERLRDDQAALLREARAAGARCREAAARWPEAATEAAMRRIAGGTAADASPNPPVKRYLDRFAALLREAEADLGRAAGGAAGAEARLAAIRTLFLGLRGLDVSGLPEDVRAAHAAQVEGCRLAGVVMKRLADAAAKGPEEFERAAATLGPDQRRAEEALSAAGRALESAAVRAGLDASDAPEWPF